MITRRKRPRREADGKRSTHHLQWVRGCRCLVPGCVSSTIEAHHVRKDGNAGTAIKPSDAYTVPLCAEHHWEGDHVGWKTFEAKYRLDLMDEARNCYRASPHRMKLNNPYG